MRRLVLSLVLLGTAGFTGSAQAPPQWNVDPLWPQPMPNHWILGSVTGVAIDAGGRTWVAHRGAASMVLRTENGLDATPKGAEHCCAAAPPLLAFTLDGVLDAHWGGPGAGYDWPQNLGGIAIDAGDHVWITAAGLPPAPAGRAGRAGAATPAPPHEAHRLQITREGTVVRQIGKAGAAGDSTSQTQLRRPSAVDVDSAANEVYVGDTGNRRVVVFDATTGAYKRHWGAYGKAPDTTVTLPAYAPGAPAAQQFRHVSCVSIARSGEVYVCDRESNRIQVFRKNGTFVREAIISPTTLGAGAAWDLAFSHDAGQQFVFVANGQEQTVHVLWRNTLAELTSIGTGGRWPGHFFGVGSVEVNSRGWVITGENLQGKRVQKFVMR